MKSSEAHLPKSEFIPKPPGTCNCLSPSFTLVFSLRVPRELLSYSH